MAIIPRVKSLLQAVPRPLGTMLSYVPYRLRPGIGPPYARYQRDIEIFEQLESPQKKGFIVAKIQRLLRAAMRVPFYHRLYQAHGVCPEDVRSLVDIANLPIVTKEMLKAVPLQERSFPVRSRYLTNTGGSSGSPLSFYITISLIPSEWAHMHTIWSKLGYTQSMLKLVFAGRNLGNRSFLYDGLRHQYSVNVYKGLESVLNDLRKITRNTSIRYLHGYPSAVAEFAQGCERFAPDLVDTLRQTLRGAFLGSEYPAQVYRHRIESVFDIPTISWYGHSERAILAWEKEGEFIYHPFQTYGYCEVVPNPDTGGWKLIGTSYENFASPFVRYDTGDDVEPVEIRDGILISFRVRSGRAGEFVRDRRGVKISLTALIFGRHHRIFEIARFVQVRQEKDGEILVIVTPQKPLTTGFVFAEWFDTTGLDMKIDFEIVDKPILSTSGKVTLKVK